MVVAMLVMTDQQPRPLCLAALTICLNRQSPIACRFLTDKGLVPGALLPLMIRYKQNLHDLPKDSQLNNVVRVKYISQCHVK